MYYQMKIHILYVFLLPGGLSETPLHGGLVGPTFACIIGIQFRNLRKCDRFWYEGGNPLIRFTEAQLDEIRKVSLSKTMCDNCDSITNIQRALSRPSSSPPQPKTQPPAAPPHSTYKLT